MGSLGRRGTPGSGGPIGLSQEPSCLTLPALHPALGGVSSPFGDGWWRGVGWHAQEHFTVQNGIIDDI